MSSSVARPIPRSGPSVLGAVLTALGGTVAWHLRHYRRVHALAQSLRVPLTHDRVVGEGEGPALRLVAIGDSVVEGVGLGDATFALPGRVAAELAAVAGRPVEVRSLGRSGQRMAAVLATQVPELAGLAADAVVVAGGTNDGLGRRPAERVAADTTALLTAVRQAAPGAAVCLVPCMDIRTAPALPRPSNHLVGWHFSRIKTAQVRAAVALGVPAVGVTARHRCTTTGRTASIRVRRASPGSRSASPATWRRSSSGPSRRVQRSAELHGGHCGGRVSRDGSCGGSS